MKKLIAISFLSFSTAVFAQEKPKSNEFTPTSKKENHTKKEAKEITSKPISHAEREALKKSAVRPETTKK